MRRKNRLFFNNIRNAISLFKKEEKDQLLEELSDYSHMVWATITQRILDGYTSEDETRWRA